MSSMDVAKFTVPELRAELGRRGLNTFGTRQMLVDRLNNATISAKESGNDPDEPPCITSTVGMRVPSQESAKQDSAVRSFGYENGSADNGQSDSRTKTDSASHEQQKRKRSLSRSPTRRSPSRSPNRRSLSRSPRRDSSRSPRRRSRSRDRDSRRSPRRRSPSASSRSRMCEEVADWEKSTSVFLDTYNCDLNLMIDSDGCTARPQTNGGFSMMWAGVRANYGCISGKSFFEVRNLRHLAVENLDSMGGGSTHVMRVGWSTENTDFALGEEPESYGYGGTGKKSCNNKFADYGCTFGEGDVVGAFIEWTNMDAILRFSVNGVDQGECYRVQKSSLGSRYALFPHIYVKNVEFLVNFGQDGQSAWYPPAIPGDDAMSWTLLNNLDVSSRVHGRLPPSSKADCEALMMMGLPGAGKTFYAERLRANNREKQYNVLGTNLILDKMKVMGLARQRNYHGRWDVLIDKATKCLNFLISVAAMRRRNYILDQTNVYPSAQRRKMRPFEGFKRRAIVIVPTDEEFRRRIAQREKEEGKEVPESAVLEMKANFGIPKPISEDPTSVFDDIVFTELVCDEANALVFKYNQEGQASRPPPEKRQRWENRDRDFSGNRDTRFRQGGYDGRDRGRDFSRGRRDDFRRSPNRRDDQGRRDYRGGYNAQRDRSRDDDRFERSRDGYGRPGRFGAPGGRFGGPPSRGGFPSGMGGPGGYGNFDNSRGGMMMRGRGGPPGPPGPPGKMSRGSFGGPGFDNTGAPPMDYRDTGDNRAPRGGRGGYRGGSDRGLGSNPPFGGQMDSMYAGRPSRFDNISSGSNPAGAFSHSERSVSAGPSVERPPFEGGGYRGGYGGGPGRGAGSSSQQGPPGGPGPYARGGGPMSRGGPMNRGGRGGRNEHDSSPVYAGVTPNMYTNAQSGGMSSYPGSEEYSDSSHDRYSAGGPTQYSNPPPKSSSGSGGNFPRATAGNTGPVYGHTGSTGFSGGYSTGGYPHAAYGSDGQPAYAGPDGYSGAPPVVPDGSGARGGRQGGRIPTPYGSEANKQLGVPRQSSESGSLYASGSARFGEGRSATPTSSGPRQSRFEDKTQPPPQQPMYSNYPQVTYSGGYSGYNSAQSGPPTVAQSGSTSRTSRTRFDVGPGANSTTQKAPGTGYAPPTASQQPSQPQSMQHVQQPSQAYGYGHSQSAKPTAVTQAGQPSATAGQASYGSYGYGAYGYGSYGNQPQGGGAAAARPQPQPTATPSLYASAVAGKPQQGVTSTPAPSNTSTSNSDPNAAAANAYAAYYGYSATSTSAASTPATTGAAGQTGRSYDAAMVAAQQFNAWQQQPPSGGSAPPATNQSVVSTTATQPAQNTPSAAYTGYYGYSGYPPGYGTAPPTGQTSAQSMQQYYAGYR